MSFKITNYLLVDIDNDFSRALAEHYFSSAQNNTPSTLVIAGSNTRQLVKMMFDDLINDYCYCNFDNEISVCELANYLQEHHDIKGVLFNRADYLRADEKQRFIYNSLHTNRILVSKKEGGFSFDPITERGYENHLSCHVNVVKTPKNLLSFFE